MDEVVGLSLVFDIAGDRRDQSLVQRRAQGYRGQTSGEEGCRGQTSSAEGCRRPNVMRERLQKAKHRTRGLR
ncbi:hypothetical protein AXF42_Ash021781 [Apostasia shenzhenica]|uniref:Uncharacterized protein n=1 Tax=Apostasia shenzhenica TaxID=1088818 RepID=A0A2H9ZR30_9ASPA|nr:hypothetical protein AXF42_Ash021781 [Apostasia shenzhenica]